ncbi:MAG: hypothetical protein AB7P04_06415 [Bacteriovoracia bacterium]
MKLLRLSFVSLFLSGVAVAAPPKLDLARIRQVTSPNFFRSAEAMEKSRDNEMSPGTTSTYQIQWYRSLVSEAKKVPSVWALCSDKRALLDARYANSFDASETLPWTNSEADDLCRNQGGVCHGWTVVRKWLKTRARFGPTERPVDNERHIDAMIQALREGEIVRFPGTQTVREIGEIYKRGLLRLIEQQQYNFNPRYSWHSFWGSLDSNLDELRQIRTSLDRGHQPYVSFQFRKGGSHAVAATELNRLPNGEWQLIFNDPNTPWIKRFVVFEANGRPRAATSAELPGAYTYNFKDPEWEVREVICGDLEEWDERDARMLQAECAYDKLREFLESQTEARHP